MQARVAGCVKEEVVMQETKRMAEEAKRMGQEAQEGVQSGFEAASKSFSEANRGFQVLAAEMMSYSKTAFDDAMRTWEQLIGVKSLEQAVEIQSQYAKKSMKTTWPNCQSSVKCVSAWRAMPLSRSKRLLNGSPKASSCSLAMRAEELAVPPLVTCFLRVGIGGWTHEPAAIDLLSFWRPVCRGRA